MENKNLPFGCILADAKGNIIEEGENTVVTDKDNIAHCEINLVHKLAGKYDWEFLNTCTVYASTELCPMCTAVIFRSGIGKIVFALSKEGHHELVQTTNPAYIFDVKSKDLLDKAKRKVEVVGPLMEEEGKSIYREWT